MQNFQDEVSQRLKENGSNAALREQGARFLATSVDAKYSYNYSWMGRPIIQYPQDVLVMQELIWSIQPDLIIETGIAHGGSIIFSASMLELNALCGGPADAEVVAVDIDIRPHNRQAIEAHPMARRIHMIQGSSVDAEVIREISQRAAHKKKVLVCLDSNHTHEHALAELEAYAPLTSVGSYCVVFDTLIEDMAADAYPDRPWGPGNNPKTAVRHYLKSHPEFVVDSELDHKTIISVAPEGYLRRIK